MAQSVLTVHYHRFDQAYDGWSLWVWPDQRGEAAREIAPGSSDAFGLVFTVPCDAWGACASIGLLPKYRNWAAKDGPDRFWRVDQSTELFMLDGDHELYFSMPPCRPFPRKAYVDSRTRFCVNFNTPTAMVSVTPATLKLFQDGQPICVTSIEPWQPSGDRARTFIAAIQDALDPELIRTGCVTMAFEGVRSGVVVPRYVYDDPHFFCDQPLGPVVDADQLFLRVWAPAALEVRAVLGATSPLAPARRAAQDTPGSHPMAYQGRGVWELSLPGDFRMWHYRLDTVFAHAPDAVMSVYDPYGRAIDRRHRTCVLVDARTPVAAPPSFPLSDAIIYELHVRDFTNDASSGVCHRGSFAGLVEEGARLPGAEGIATGLDHLRELGINTIQLMPVQAFDIDETRTRHAWGYMPVHYNAPEPVYASDGSGATAVLEFKHAVDALHRNGFKVVMDVVYNHSTEGPAHAEHWNGLVPEFFYRVRPDGVYWNGSGCGNEFRFEAPMARKFLLDSLSYWVREYGIDGFRFDLMGLMDKDTMLQVVAALNGIRPSMFLYGEPWTAWDTPIKPIAKGDQRGAGFGCFNDLYRGALVGNVFDDGPGYVCDGHGRADVKRGWSGSGDWFAARADETINYVECHDNRTLADRISVVAGALTSAEQTDTNRLAAFLVLLAQGVPFLHEGQEFARSKANENNSYNLGDKVNNLRWQCKAAQFSLHTYYRGLMRLRAAHPVFRLSSLDEIASRIFWGAVPPPCLLCQLDAGGLGDTWRRAVALVNPTTAPLRHMLPWSTTGWHVHVQNDQADVDPLAVLKSDRRLVVVAPRSAMLLAEIERL